MTVLIYVDTTKQVGHPDHLKVFANADAAEARFAENDPKGVAFEIRRGDRATSLNCVSFLRCEGRFFPPSASGSVRPIAYQCVARPV